MMLSSFPQQMGTKSERKLCKLYSSLDDKNRLALMRFAEFLVVESVKSEKDDKCVDDGTDIKPVDFPEPKIIPAPKDENIIKAIKRISAMYYMVDKAKMLDRTSTLMTEHLMHGRPVQDVVADVEKGFKQEYDKLCKEYTKK